MVVQLTVWVRGAMVERVKEADQRASNSRPEINDSLAGEEGMDSGDPCSSLQSCKWISTPLIGVVNVC